MAVKKKVVTPSTDDLAKVIADSLNSLMSEEGKVAYFLDGSDDTPIDLDDWVSTGATMLDLAISNRPHGGLPVGRIIELTGLEQSGKSLLAAHVIANTQKLGGIGVFIDTESAANEDFWRAIGLDMGQMVYSQVDALEDAFEYIETIIEKVRKSNKDTLVTIVVDSVSGASTKTEMESNYEKDGWATAKSIILSKAMRKITNLVAKQRILLIFTNQLRQKMNAMPFSDPYTTSGGMAIGFHSSVRLRLQVKGTLKNKDKEIVGVTVMATVKKNRCGPPLRKAEFDIYFDRGIDDYASWLKIMKEKKLITGAGHLTYVDNKGEEIKIASKDFSKFLEEDQERKEEIYNNICEKVIMSYRNTDEQDIIFDGVVEE